MTGDDPLRDAAARQCRCKGVGDAEDHDPAVRALLAVLDVCDWGDFAYRNGPGWHIRRKIAAALGVDLAGDPIHRAGLRGEDDR